MTFLSHSEVAQRLEQLTDLSVELSTHRDVGLLLEKILRVAKSMTRADGGTLYRVSADRKSLCFHISVNDSLSLHQGGVRGGPVPLADIPLENEDGSPNLGAVAACVANTRRSVNVSDAYASQEFVFSGMRKFDAQFNYHSKSFLTVPMQDHEGELIGVLQLVNAIDAHSGKIRPFTDTDRHFIEALASQAAFAITNQQLISRMEDLFESFVKMINICIDEKSAHTGRHCEHVPALTMMLAEAAHRTGSGPLGSFRMDDANRKQLWLAGLLHDCGKITTPDHVMEKATKLETIFDRIHLIDTRFEVLRRDARIHALEQKVAALRRGGGQPEAVIDRLLTEELARLDEDRAFLRRANIGVESMSAEDQERVTRIARYLWQGPDGTEQAFLTPEEVTNLTVRAGTLNADERKIINNHISVTIRMLESLPWPKHLQNVPEYAGAHHERMDGKGYPRGLTGDQMSVQARAMAIADIFEAITAKDRPYKKANTLSESLRILGGFRVRNHIDPDLFDVFIRQKVYLDYARRFLDPSQIDEVDEGAIPGYMP